MTRGVLFAYKLVPVDSTLPPDEAAALAVESARAELTEELLTQGATREELVDHSRFKSRAANNPDEVVVVATVVIHR